MILQNNYIQAFLFFHDKRVTCENHNSISIFRIKLIHTNLMVFFTGM